jgi:hypothetical protein
MLEEISDKKVNVSGVEIDMGTVTNSIGKLGFIDDINKIDEFVRKHYALDYEIIELQRGNNGIAT